MSGASDTAPRRAIGYVRVSTTEQAQRGLGLPVQRQAIVDHARAEGYELLRVYEDPGLSGTLALHERPGLRDALSEVKRREGDPFPVVALIVPKWDRLARDTLVGLVAEQEFNRHGCEVHSADGIGADRTTREIFMVLAGAERRNIVARMQAGRRAKAAKGEYAGGGVRLGFRPDRTTGRVVPMRASTGELEGTARVVNWIFYRVAKDRWTTGRIVRELNDHGTLGITWDNARISRIVRCHDYKRGTRPIVDPRVWNRAQEVRAARTRGGRVAAAA